MGILEGRVAGGAAAANANGVTMQLYGRPFLRLTELLSVLALTAKTP